MPERVTEALPHRIARRLWDGDWGAACRREFERAHPGVDPLADEPSWALWVQHLRPNAVLIESIEDPGREVSCPKCRDGGWLYQALKKTDPDYGRAIPCPYCTEQREADRLAKCRLEQSGIPETKRQVSFDTFKEMAGTREAFRAARSLAEGSADFKLLLIYGPHGNGKTHLAYAAALYRLRAGQHVQFRYVPTMFRELRQAMKEDRVDDILMTLGGCHLLVLDDLGAEQGTAWQDERLEDIVDERYRRELPLICTSNRDLRGLPPAIVSRFRESGLGKIVFNEGKDYRPGKGG